MGLHNVLLKRKFKIWYFRKGTLETVIKIEGKVVNRSSETINKDIETGEVEVTIEKFEVLGTCKELPMPVFSNQEYAEEIRLKYRFLG